MFIIYTIIRNRLGILVAAFKTLPSPETWRLSIVIFILYGAITTPIGFLTGLLRVETMEAPLWVWVLVPLVLFIRPALIEEVFFRVLMLPRPGQTLALKYRLSWIIVSLVIFVAWHPINGIVFRPEVAATFTDPAFLFIVLFLGIACSTAYLKSGSIWPPILIHWVTDVVWVLFMGGAEAAALAGLFTNSKLW